MSLSLTGPLPEKVEVGGKLIPIRTDFRVGIRFTLLLEDPALSSLERFGLMLRMYYPQVPRELEEGLLRIMWFYRCGCPAEPDLTSGEAEPRTRTSGEAEPRTRCGCEAEPDPEPGGAEKGRGSETGGRPLFSYEQDGGLIYAAFLEQYGLDLTEVRGLHWWKFRALFEGLRGDCFFRQVVSWRATPLSDKMTKEERALLRSRKALYRLPDRRSPEQRQADFERAMAEGF